MTATYSIIMIIIKLHIDNGQHIATGGQAYNLMEFGDPSIYFTQKWR